MLSSVSSRLAYPYTLVSIYRQYLLSSEDINLLISESCGDDVARILNKAGLDSMSNDMDDKGFCQYSGNKMDDLFLSHFVNHSINIVRAFSGGEHQFLMHWLRQVEISNIKAILRGKAMRRSADVIEKQLFDLGPFTTLSTEVLLHAEDVPEVLRQLEQSPYAALAHFTIAQYNRAHNDRHMQIFSLETSVDKQFFIGLVRRVNMLSQVDKAALHPLVGRIIDQVNLVRLLRYRLNYELSPSHTYFLLSTGGFHLKQQELLQLVKITHIENLQSLLSGSLSEQIGENLPADQQTIQMINSIMEKDVIEQAQKVLTMKPFSIATVYAYLLIRRYQLSLIHAILKGRSMQVDENSIRFITGVT